MDQFIIIRNAEEVCEGFSMKIGKDVIRKVKPKITETKVARAYRGELLPPSVRRTTVDFVKALEKHKLEYMVIGAVPVQFYGRERFSRDVDVAIFLSGRNANAFLKILKSGRYKVRYPLPHEHKLEKPEDLLDWHLLRLVDLKHNSSLDVYLKPERLGLDMNSLTKAKVVVINGEEIVIPSPEDYLLTKFISRRPSSHDFEDIISILIKQHETINWKYLEDKAEKYDVLFLLKYYKDAIEKKMARKKQ